MINILKLMISFLLLLSLSSCWIPEEFVTKVIIYKDGHYSVKYDGILTAVSALKATKLSDKDEIELRDIAKEMKKERGFKQVSYIGKGKYKVLYERKYTAEEESNFISKQFNYLNITPSASVLSIQSRGLNAKEINKLDEIGAKIKGTLIISVENGLTIDSHNSKTGPISSNSFKDFTWDINSFESYAYMEIDPQNRIKIAKEREREEIIKKRKHPLCNQDAGWSRYITTSNLTIRDYERKKIGLLKKGDIIKGICTDFDTLDNNISSYWISIMSEGDHSGEYVFGHYLKPLKTKVTPIPDKFTGLWATNIRECTRQFERFTIRPYSIWFFESAGELLNLKILKNNSIEFTLYMSGADSHQNNDFTLSLTDNNTLMMGKKSPHEYIRCQ